MPSNINTVEDKRIFRSRDEYCFRRQEKARDQCSCVPFIICCICSVFVSLIVGIVLIVRSITNVTFTSCNDFQLYSRTHDASLRRIQFLKGCDCNKIVIGNESFRHVRDLKVDGLEELESVVIGENCFTYSTSDVSNSNRKDGKVQIKDCPRLKLIQVGPYSFSDYHSLELTNLPSLESIEMGSFVFYLMQSLSLSGLREWTA